ncbi:MULTISPECIES: hypothetical protein [Streptomyces]|uniref:DUF4386 family protein n=1 Tax=Streptomyces morookaense TaxID=1970 RepID=A0A7Y7B4D4_STRMO|nr:MULTISPECIES: hypothetical protein [Streptomyces]MCC2273920.1 hypothetical protein [Streptomyces sp. ET3-23]NVK78772.1 hypothetical protein [Streptomyces morookaense]GHF34635.1 hypothetical protein GCM10010359_41400 [Streptomyces morookaense]
MRTSRRAAGQGLRTPRVAAVAGIVSALLLGGVVVLVRLAVPEHPQDAADWFADGSRRDSLHTALAMVPFAGVFFLWFMGCFRDYVGAAEDRFFATLFLGSGLLFLATLFVLAVTAGSLLAVTGFAMRPPAPGRDELWQYGRHFVLTLLSGYFTRMAAVFVLSTTTIGHRLGVFPRWLSWLGYLVALVLLFSVSSTGHLELAFPVWMLAVSGHILVRTLRTRSGPPTSGGG